MVIYMKMKKKAFTLVELMAVVTILGIIYAIGAPILNKVNQNIMMANTRIQIQQEARSIMFSITRILRNAVASSVVISRYNSSQPFYSKISFTTVDGKNYTFYQNNKEFVMEVDNYTRTLTKNLRYLAFTFPESSNMSIISVSLTLEKDLFSGRKKALHMASEKIMLMN